MNLTLSQAQTALNAAHAKAKEIETKMNICIVDAGSNLIAFLRMDDAWIGSIDIATKKAKTAAWFQMNTEVLSKMVQPGQDLYAIEHSNGGLITFPGGVAIKDASGKVIGAIGVSGGTVKEDNKVAKAGAEALGSKD